MNILRFFSLLCMILLANSAIANEVDNEDAEVSCQQPPIGIFKGSCEALKNPADTSPHIGDQWITCEVDSGEHGIVGMGVALFYSDKALPYWTNEVSSYLKQIKAKIPMKEYMLIETDQKRWLMLKPALEERIRKKYEKMEGSIYRFRASNSIAGISRERALKLGCRLELLESSGSGESNSKL